MKIKVFKDPMRNGARASLRQTLLDVANNRSPEQSWTRTRAMCILQMLATAIDLQEEMWNDLPTRATLNDGAASNDNPKAQGCALAALVYLSTQVNIRYSMWNFLPTRNIVLAAANRYFPPFADARRLAVAVLQNLAKDARNRVPMWFEKAAGILLRNANPNIFTLLSPPDRESRARALATIWELALDGTVRERMWGDKFGAMRVITAAASSPNPFDFQARLYAMAAVSRLAESVSNRVRMWFDPIMHSTVIAAAWDFRPAFREVRAAAMATLWQFSFDPVLKVLMWMDVATRTTLLTAAACTNPLNHKVREYALAIEFNLAQAKLNQAPMWAYVACSTPLVAAANEVARIRTFALSVLQVLAFSPLTKPAMWAAERLRRALDAAADLSSTSSVSGPDAISRNYALAILQLLSVAPCNKLPMYTRRSTNLALVDACTARWSEQAIGRRGRTYALTTYQNYVTVPKASVLMFHDTLVMKSLAVNSRVSALLPAVGLDAEARLVEELLPGYFGSSETVLQAAGEAAALATLAGLAANRDLQALFWHAPEPDSKAARLNIVGASGLFDLKFSVFRLNGLQGLAHLAEELLNRLEMWLDQGVRSALVDAGRLRPSLQQSSQEAALWQDGMLSAIRRHGQCGLANLARLAAVSRLMWIEERSTTRLAFLNGCNIQPANSEDYAARACAVDGLAKLASQTANQVSMFHNDEIRRCLMAAAQSKDKKDNKAMMFAVSALQELAAAEENQEQMWGGNQVVDSGTRRRSRRLSGPRGPPIPEQRPRALRSRLSVGAAQAALQ